MKLARLIRSTPHTPLTPICLPFGAPPNDTVPPSMAGPLTTPLLVLHLWLLKEGNFGKDVEALI